MDSAFKKYTKLRNSERKPSLTHVYVPNLAQSLEHNGDPMNTVWMKWENLLDIIL